MVARTAQALASRRRDVSMGDAELIMRRLQAPARTSEGGCHLGTLSIDREAQAGRL
jgi:hypothetical protein